MMRVDRAAREIKASRQRVYEALVDREAVRSWLPPRGARAVVHAFEPCPGGAFRLTLEFDSPGGTGRRKSSANTDVVDGEFLELVPGELVRQRFTFRSDDPAFAGAMIMTWTLGAAAGGTRVTVTAQDVPEGIDPGDHEAGMASSLANLAGYVERKGGQSRDN